ncbi:hypothetical protein [Methylomonas sp. AM2-LC]|uniref:hypothetical protein n=1 Tax=Methylomonas sp. AM2-LC TaxID=3153301 RepID=UPI0032632158
MNLRAFLSATLFLSSNVIAQADTLYDFSYKFNSGDIVTGSFKGTPNGNLITNLTDISVSLDGNTLISGAQAGFAWSYNGSSFGLFFTGAVASFNDLQNNFYFVNTSNTTPPISTVGGGYFYSETTPLTICVDSNQGSCTAYNPTNFVGASQGSIIGAKYVYDGGSGNLPNNSWSITAVPEAEEWIMMLLGLPLVGWFVRRKQS